MTDTSPKNPIFCTATVLVYPTPMTLNMDTMTSEGGLDDAIAKTHDFFHNRLGVPASWLIAENVLDQYGPQFRQWREEYGDEFGIFEPGLLAAEPNPGWAQVWPEKLGWTRPLETVRWADMPEDQQFEAMQYLKSRMDEALGQNTKMMYAANGGANTVRAMKRAGLEILWGYNWGLYGDGVDATGRGSLFTPFYISDVNQKVPAPPGDRAVLAAHWSAGDFLHYYHTTRTARVGTNNACFNAHEIANRSGDTDRDGFIRKAMAQLAEQAEWNPFVFLPVQIEAGWIDESEYSYGHFPRYNSHTTEMFFHTVETAMRLGAKMVTQEGFLNWYRSQFDQTPETLYYLKDIIPGQRFRGKDLDFPETVLYGSTERQIIFSRSEGFNPSRRYDYIPVQPADDPRLEYPFTIGAPVELKIKEWTTPFFGVQISPEGAFYHTEDLTMTAYEDDPTYACALWDCNIPDYVGVEDLELSPNITGVKLLPERNFALVFAPMTKGTNVLSLHSDKPGQYIKIEDQRRSGRRYEIYIRNTGAPVHVSQIKTNIGLNLRVGGFWWDGRYHSSLYHYHFGPYFWHTGDIEIKTAYPLSLPLPTGLTRCSIEILGQLP